MNLFKAVKDMGSMLNAAPDLFASANELADNAKAQAAAAEAQASAAAAKPTA